MGSKYQRPDELAPSAASALDSSMRVGAANVSCLQSGHVPHATRLALGSVSLTTLERPWER